MEKILSNIELYYSPDENISGSSIFLSNDEYKHAVKVMRNSIGDTIYITNGIGSIFKCEVVNIERDILSAKILDEIIYENRLGKIFFCIPKLKNPDRFKFAIEKSVELGIVNFIVYESERTVAKGTNIKRWDKIALSAMKQSLSSYKPNIQTVNSLDEIENFNGEKIVFEQNADKEFHFQKDSNVDYYFIFGPEGGLTNDELMLFENFFTYSLGDRRLRTETAIIKVASLL
ncbi:MAG: 16S rRNA (uracil(1498)-N(3))-methyltransferase [Ignavibacterium sp.]|nr:MAG: 16S rRNA (uracil(1498)-N(3))-methyltransferase [Ignavibacterium sp.]